MTSERLSRDALVERFQGYGRPKEQWLVGAELERHLLTPQGLPLPYFGEPGVKWLMGRFATEGWEPYLEGQHPIALFRDRASITLEPGGQYELSGAPFQHLADIHAEASTFVRDVDRHLEGTGITQAALGFTPWAHIPDVPWVPKGRYVVMRAYLAETGPLAHDMMKGTCAVQASYDFADEADCAAKVQLATRLGPLTTAMFANSPYRHGKAGGWASWRGHAWTLTDPSRTGFPEAAVDFSFERWVDYLLDTPMMFKKSADGAWHPAHGQTFRDWLDDPVAPPTEADWELHLTSVFPEVRIKKQIEVRGADCVPLDLAMGFVALFKGLFYCNRGHREADALSQRLMASGSREERFDTACRDGLKGRVGDRRYADYAGELLDIAHAALGRCAPEEQIWLAPLMAQVARGESPAHTLLAELGPEPTPAALAAATHPLRTR